MAGALLGALLVQAELMAPTWVRSSVLMWGGIFVTVQWGKMYVIDQVLAGCSFQTKAIVGTLYVPLRFAPCNVQRAPCTVPSFARQFLLRCPGVAQRGNTRFYTFYSTLLIVVLREFMDLWDVADRCKDAAYF